MKKKTKKILFTIILISLISLFIYLKNRSYDYERIYNVDQFKIIEEYTKFESSYNFTIKYDNLTYPYKIYKKFLKEKELIEKIEVYKNDEETCILPYSTKLDFYPICNNEKEIYNYNISSIKVDEFKYPEIKRLNKNYENIKIKSYNDNNFLIYNYKGFYYLSNDESKNIQLFEKDIYSLQLIYQLDEYILIADYNEEYYFDKFYLINMNNGKLEEIEINEKISFNSEFLGDYKNNIYLLDKKEEKEYKININKKKVEKTDFVILKNNKLNKTTYKKIINNNLKFENNNIELYEIKDNILFQVIDDYLLKISEKKVDKIIKIEKDNVYYISNENLYMYNNLQGEILLIEYFEWNFNNTNMVYLYK